MQIYHSHSQTGNSRGSNEQQPQSTDEMENKLTLWTDVTITWLEQWEEYDGCGDGFLHAQNLFVHSSNSTVWFSAVS